MKNIIMDWLQERKSKMQYLANKLEAEEIWETQKDAISSIKKHAGFIAIRDYFMRELEASIERLETAPAGDKNAQENLKITKKFLSWLDSRA